MMYELSAISNLVTDFLAKCATLNTLFSESGSAQHYNQIHECYYFVEKNYTEIFLTEVLFGYCWDCGNQCNFSEAEKKLMQSQRIFADKYRELYHVVHAFMNLYIQNMHNVRNGSEHQITYRIPAADGEVLPPLLPDLHSRNDVLDEINRTVEQEVCLSKINAMVREVRDCFVVFTHDSKTLEQERLKKSAPPKRAACKCNRLEAYKLYCQNNPL